MVCSSRSTVGSFMSEIIKANIAQHSCKRGIAALQYCSSLRKATSTRRRKIRGTGNNIISEQSQQTVPYGMCLQRSVRMVLFVLLQGGKIIFGGNHSH